MGALAGLILSVVLFLIPSSAQAYDCGDHYCNGNDSTTGTNSNGNAPQVYFGEVGVYTTEFGSSTGPCTGYSNPDNSCFNVSAAKAAQAKNAAGAGIGVEGY